MSESAVSLVLGLISGATARVLGAPSWGAYLASLVGITIGLLLNHGKKAAQ